jgi:hypothetical protein
MVNLAVELVLPGAVCKGDGRVIVHSLEPLTT